MRKIFLVLFIFSAVFLSANKVEDLDGFDWITASSDSKIGYVQGFYAAYSSIWERFYTEAETDFTDEEVNDLENMFYIPLLVGEMVDRIDNYYADYDRRDQRLYHVLMFIAGKDYWNSSRFDEPETSKGSGET